MVFQLPAIQDSVPITDPQTGMMTAYFSNWLTRVLNQITAQINTNSATIAALQQQQAQLLALIQTVQAVQNQISNPGVHTGFATQVLNVGLGWSMGPQVNLTGLAAGDLTLHGTGPTQQSSTTVDNGNFVGNWRIQEIVGLSETTVFTGTFSAGTSEDPDFGIISYYVYNNTDTTSIVIPTVTTGAVSYRMDLEFTAGVSAFDVVANLYVART